MFPLGVEGIGGDHGPVQVTDLAHQVREVRDLVRLLPNGLLADYGPRGVVEEGLHRCAHDLGCRE